MTRSILRPIPLDDALALLTGARRGLIVTMGRHQWDALLASCYEQGWVLLELDDDERPVRAFQRVVH